MILEFVPGVGAKFGGIEVSHACASRNTRSTFCPEPQSVERQPE